MVGGLEELIFGDLLMVDICWLLLLFVCWALFCGLSSEILLGKACR